MITAHALHNLGRLYLKNKKTAPIIRVCSFSASVCSCDWVVLCKGAEAWLSPIHSYRQLVKAADTL